MQGRADRGHIAAVGAVLVTRDRADHLHRALTALVDQTRPPQRTVVVDNGEHACLIDDRLSARLAVEVIRPDSNVGFGGGLALGLERLAPTCDAMFMSDDDSCAAPDLLARLVSVLEHDATVGMVGTQGGALRRGTPVWSRSHRHRDVAGETVAEVDFCLVDQALVRRDVVVAVGPPDARLFMSFEDVEFGLRVSDTSYEVVALDAAVERAHAGAGAPWRAYYQARNHLFVAWWRRSPSMALGALFRNAKFVLWAALHGDGVCVRMRVRGVIDGLRMREGIVIDPVGPAEPGR